MGRPGTSPQNHAQTAAVAIKITGHAQLENISVSTNNSHRRLSPFQLFKYAVYLLLVFNNIEFYLEESAAALLIHPNGVAWKDFIDAYAATVDTASWVILLLLFELETWTIPDEKLTPAITRTFTVLRALCYASIAYALYGYIQTYFELDKWAPIASGVSDVCGYLGDSFMYSLERFVAVSTENCQTLASSNDLLGFKGNLITDSSHYHVSWMLAIADVINASDWLLIVLILEFEVWLLSKGPLKDTAFNTIKAVKVFFYAVLVSVAVFWGVYGEFIDFWDAFIWIAAFVFIENNVIQWQEETAGAD